MSSAIAEHAIKHSEPSPRGALRCAAANQLDTVAEPRRLTLEVAKWSPDKPAIQALLPKHVRKRRPRGTLKRLKELKEILGNDTRAVGGLSEDERGGIDVHSQAKARA